MPTEAPPAPPPIEPTPPAPPVTGAGDETSKSIFNQQRVEAGLDQKVGIPADVIDPSKAQDAPPVPEAIAEIDAMVLPKNAKPEQVANFTELKTKAKAHLQAALDRAADLEKQIGKATSATELEELRGKLTAAEAKAAEIEEQFSKVAYEKSPKFQAQFANREQTALDLAKMYLDGTEIKPDIIDLAAHATGRKRIEILKDAGLDDSAIQLVSPHLATYDTVQREKQFALTNWKTEATRQQQEAQQLSERAKQQRSEQENKVWDQVASKLDLIPLRSSKENAEWNQRAESLKAEAKKIFNGDGADLPTFAETILKGKAYDAQQEVVDHLRGEVETLRSENARLKSAAPGAVMNAGSQDTPPTTNTKTPHIEQAKSTFNQELSKARA
jgi:hypothetical protein